MAVDFPASPVLNDVFVAGTRQYQWNGVAWVSTGGAVGGGGGSITFTGSPKIYGRTVAGAGEGHEISVGPWLKTTTTSIDGQAGIKGYQTDNLTPNYRVMIGSENLSDPSVYNYSTFISSSAQPLGFETERGSYSTLMSTNSAILSGDYNSAIASDQIYLENGSYNAIIASQATPNLTYINTSTASAVIATSGFGTQDSTNCIIAGCEGLGNFSYLNSTALLGSRSNTGTITFDPGAVVTCSAVIAADGFTITQNKSTTCALAHGAGVTPISYARTFNYSTNNFANDIYGVYETTMSGVTQLVGNTVYEFSYLNGGLYELLLGPRTTLADTIFFVQATIIGFYGTRRTVWKCSNIFDGTGINTATASTQTLEVVNSLGSAFDVLSIPSLGVDGSNLPVFQFLNNEAGGPALDLYAEIRVQFFYKP